MMIVSVLMYLVLSMVSHKFYLVFLPHFLRSSCLSKLYDVDSQPDGCFGRLHFFFRVSVTCDFCYFSRYLKVMI